VGAAPTEIRDRNRSGLSSETGADIGALGLVGTLFNNVMNEAWGSAIVIAVISLGWLALWLIAMLVIGKMQGKRFYEAMDDSVIPNRASLIALQLVALAGLAIMLAIETTMRDRIATLCMVGVFATICVGAYYWERPVYRLIPFAGATIFGLTLGWTWEKPYLEVLKTIMAINVATGLLLGAWWLEERSGIRKKGETGN